jgi:hypothetical protein
MPQNKKNVATKILLFDFELFIGGRFPWILHSVTFETVGAGFV